MENSFSTSNPQEDLLSDDLMVNVQQASVGKRFANHLVDMIVFFVVAIIILALLIGMHVMDADANELQIRLLYFVFYGLWQGTLEAIFKGKTLGKVFTRTRAVNEDGSRISIKTAYLRGLSRLVPFEAFSAFGGYPWHDRWTQTYVIDQTRSIIN